MANKNKREALRGAEEEIFDVLAQVLTSEQWAGLLKAPLEHAAIQGNRGLAQKLMRAEAEIGDALHAAAQFGQEVVVNELLENGASLDAKDAHGSTPLHLAAREGETEMVQLLVLKGADKDVQDSDESTPLAVATWCGRAAAALALMAAGADVSLQSTSVLRGAARHGFVGIIRAAIERGADVDAAGDIHQGTALHMAALQNQVEAIGALVKAGANTNSRDVQGCTPLHDAAGCVRLEALVTLLQHGAHVNAQDQDQDTPLHWAAAKAGTARAAEVVDSLLRAGADENILNSDGKAAMDVVGINDAGDLRVAEDVDRVRELLEKAPADRAWRRRGYLVLCRAHPDRVQLIQDMDSAHAGGARRTRSREKLTKTQTGSRSGAVDASPVDGRGGGDWAGVVAMVLRLQEEGIFRTIVTYL